MRLFAVGDVDQSIYGFAGANPALLQSLADREDVETIYLRLNYRCGKKIVTASTYALGEEREYKTPDAAQDGTIFFHPYIGDYRSQADHIFEVLLPQIQERNPELNLADIAVLYPAAWIGDAVAESATAHSYEVVRTDTNSLYPRGSRILRWLEQCAEWCCGGWRNGRPRFRRLIVDGMRIFSEALPGEVERQEFQRQLLELLWARRDATTPLSAWLEGIYQSLIQPIATIRAIADEIEIFQTFYIRTLPGNDCEAMTLANFAGQSSGVECINLSTLHSSKGREFSIVIMFAMDENRIPRRNVSPKEILEARRLFYVGFTRAKSELHIVHTRFRPSAFVTEVEQRLNGNLN